jgi:hypothetical protein
VTKEELAALRHLRQMLMTENMERCGFQLPGRDPFDKSSAKDIAEATRIWRESWVLPLLDALLGDVKGSGYLSRREALRHGVKGMPEKKPDLKAMHPEQGWTLARVKRELMKGRLVYLVEMRGSSVEGRGSERVVLDKGERWIEFGLHNGNRRTITWPAAALVSADDEGFTIHDDQLNSAPLYRFAWKKPAQGAAQQEVR